MENNTSTKQLKKKKKLLVVIIIISLVFIAIITTIGILRNAYFDVNSSGDLVMFMPNTMIYEPISDQVITDVIQEMYSEENTYPGATSSDALIYRPIGSKVKSLLYGDVAKLTVRDNDIVAISTDTENITTHIRHIFEYPQMYRREMCDIIERKVKDYNETINNKEFTVEKYFVKWNVREGPTESIVAKCEEYITFYIESDTDEIALIALNDCLLVGYESQGIETEHSNEE